jgi:hypothetical protein
MMAGLDDLSEEELMALIAMQPQNGGYMPMPNGSGKDFTNTSEQAKQTNLMQDWLKSIMDPQFAMLGQAMGQTGGLDFSQFLGERTNGQNGAPMPPGVVVTPVLDSYQASAGTDEIAAMILEMVNNNATSGSINTAIRTATGEDENAAKDYIADAASLRTEQTSFAQAQADWANESAQLSPLEQQYRDAGLPSPMAEYDEAAVNPDAARTRDNFNADTDLAEQAKAALKKHMNGPFQNSLGRSQGAKPAGEKFDSRSDASKAWDFVKGDGLDGAKQYANFVLGEMNPAYRAIQGAGAVGNVIGGLFSSKKEPDDKQGRTPSTRTGSRAGGGRGRTENLPESAQFTAERKRLETALSNAQTQAKASRKEKVFSDNRTKSAQFATRGRNPSDDAIYSRQLLLRQLGM